MVRLVWVMTEDQSCRLLMVSEKCDFIEPVKRYLDYLAALEKSPNTLENYGSARTETTKTAIPIYGKL